MKPGFWKCQLLNIRCDKKKTAMATVDELIDLIDDRSEKEAIEFLNKNPDLATGNSSREGVLSGATPLHWAAHRNYTQLCEQLVELGAEVNSSDARWWRTPLAWAADAACTGAVAFLLEKRADVNQDTYRKTTALHAAAQGGSTSGTGDPDGYRRTAEILIEHGADINVISHGGQSPLGDAVRKENESIITLLREVGAEEHP